MKLLLGVLVLVLVCVSVEGKKRVMPWMCLERCNFTSEEFVVFSFFLPSCSYC